MKAGSLATRRVAHKQIGAKGFSCIGFALLWSFSFGNMFSGIIYSPANTSFLANSLFYVTHGASVVLVIVLIRLLFKGVTLVTRKTIWASAIAMSLCALILIGDAPFPVQLLCCVIFSSATGLMIVMWFAALSISAKRFPSKTLSLGFLLTALFSIPFLFGNELAEMFCFIVYPILSGVILDNLEGTQHSQGYSLKSWRKELVMKRETLKESGRWDEDGGISRRGFLAGGALLGASAAVGTLAGCAPKEAGDGTQANGLKEGQYAFEVAPEAIPESEIVKTVEADVVIVGAGLSGTFAALAAAEEGASVIIIQKSSIPITHGIGWTVFDAEAQREVGSEFDLKEWTDYFTVASYGYANQAYVESIVYNSGRAADMLGKYAKERGDAFGKIIAVPGATICMWDNPEVTNGYSRVPTMVSKMTELCVELGVEYYYSSPAKQLEKDGDRVVAVIADGPEGYFRAKGNKGVILSTGDIGNNPEMVAKYAPFCQGLLNTYAPADDTGDGHQMALWAGARMFTGPFTQAIHYDPSPLPEGDAPFSGSPYLAVNARGLRYQNEDLAYPIIANLNVQQPDKLRWQIIDNTFTANWNDFLPGMCRNAGFQFNTNEEAYDACLANGAIKQADTLEELADIIGFQGADRDNFFATIERYNELADKGIDEDFGKNPEYLKKTAVREGPFYSIKRSPGPLALLDGIYSTPKMEALDDDMNIMPGLYVTGNVVHSMFGCDYTLNPGGISCGHAIASGYIAGKSVVDKLPDYKSYYKPPSGTGTPVTPGV